MMLLLLGALIAPAAAQSSDAGPAFNGIRTPVSPAFVLLGIAPTEVERPNTPADLAFSVLNRSAAFTSLPRDVALEISPYWLVGHPTLRWEDDTVRGLGASLARTMTLSFATAELGTSARPITGLALGLRAAPFSGHLSHATIAQLDSLGARLTDKATLIAQLNADEQQRLLQRLERDLENVHNAPDSAAMRHRTAEAVARIAQRSLDNVEVKAAQDSIARLLGDLAVIREGFVLEIAGGAALRALGGAADSARVARWGAWVTAGYEGPSLSFVFVNRFLASSVDSTSDAVDLGMRLLFATGRYALSAEGTFRTFTERGAPPNQYRFAALVDFELQKGLWVTGTFGRDYSADAPGSLIAQIGLSINVAGDRIELPLRSMR
jgi:hypothetical protein